MMEEFPCLWKTRALRRTCLNLLRCRMRTSGRVQRLSLMRPCCSCLQCGQRQASSGASWNATHHRKRPLITVHTHMLMLKSYIQGFLQHNTFSSVPSFQASNRQPPKGLTTGLFYTACGAVPGLKPTLWNVAIYETAQTAEMLVQGHLTSV